MTTLRTLCTGGGLFDIGAQLAGWQHVDGYEVDPQIAAVAIRNGFHVHVADICAVDYMLLPTADHLHVSPPCTSASLANPNAGETEMDIALGHAIARAIVAHQGATFSLENVWPYRTYAAFQAICAALQEQGFSIDIRHINAADYGVPQTRKRLILRAVRGRRVPTLQPTHQRHGDLFSAPWVSWYAAIADLLPTLPDTQPAPWQVRRLVRLPAFSFLIGMKNTGTQNPLRANDQPSFTCTAEGGFRCYLIDGASGDGLHGVPTHRHAMQPSMTVTASERSYQRLVWPGVWKQLTVQAYGRLQTLPDSYQGATRRIIGNGVPCLLARRIMESLGS